MENASKALIIAGAILLAIVIISLGLIVVNNVRTTTDNTNLSEQEIQSFNAKFIPYEGNNVSGSRVNTLIQQVLASNQDTLNSGKLNYVAISFPSISITNGKYVCLYVAKYNDNIVPFAFTLDNKDAATINSFKEKSPIKNNFQNSSQFYDATSASPSVSLSVNTGKQYKVNLGYEGGIIRLISCIEN